MTNSVINSDTPCVGCGYNLFGLDRNGRCPECGTIVADSVRGEGLAFANRKWLAEVCRGLTFLYAACLISLASVAAGFVGMTIVSLVFTSARWFTLARVLFRIILLVVPVLAIIGVFKVTAPDPGASLNESPTSLRRMARATAVAMLATILLWLGIEQLVLSANMSKNAGETLIGISGFLAGVLVLIMVVTLFEYLATLADRIPNPHIARTGVYTARAFVVFFVLAYLCQGTSPPGGVGQLEGLKRFVPIFGGICWLVYVIMGIKLMSLVGSYRQAIVECADESRLLKAIHSSTTPRNNE